MSGKDSLDSSVAKTATGLILPRLDLRSVGAGQVSRTSEAAASLPSLSSTESNSTKSDSTESNSTKSDSTESNSSVTNSQKSYSTESSQFDKYKATDQTHKARRAGFYYNNLNARRRFLGKKIIPIHQTKKKPKYNHLAGLQRVSSCFQGQVTWESKKHRSANQNTVPRLSEESWHRYFGSPLEKHRNQSKQARTKAEQSHHRRCADRALNESGDGTKSLPRLQT
jgi:hypothetical protein